MWLIQSTYTFSEHSGMCQNLKSAYLESQKLELWNGIYSILFPVSEKNGQARRATPVFELKAYKDGINTARHFVRNQRKMRDTEQCYSQRTHYIGEN